MAELQIRFDDGAAYERFMGSWSRLAGDTFLDWLAPGSGLRWIDVGCGNGAFTELLVERCAPANIQGIDPSEAQLSFTRAWNIARVAEFHNGNAFALPFPDNSFDAAVMVLVIFFVPDPAKGVAEMARAVSPGGMVAAYAWELFGGGFPLDDGRSSTTPTVVPARGDIDGLPTEIMAVSDQPFAAKNVHQPLELMSPSTISHLPAMKCLHLLHCCWPFGLSWYFASSLLFFAAKAGAAPIIDAIPATVIVITEVSRNHRRDTETRVAAFQLLVNLAMAPSSQFEFQY